MAGVRLRFLGSGDAFGSGGRFQTCLHVTGPGGALLVDCGASSLIPMKRAGLDPREIGWVVLSHLHGDHFGGVPYLVLDGQFSRRTRPLVIAGPPGVRARVEAAMEILFPGSSTVARRFPLEFVELIERTPAAIGPVAVTPFAVRHPSGAPAYALRLEWDGAVLAYSGDTEWVDALPDAARGADLFVCEAYTFEKPVPYHLDYRTVAAQLGRLDCRRLILSHLGPEMLARQGEAAVECAHDGLTVEL